jgi:vacuolar-type H+-ATPase subunit H
MTLEVEEIVKQLISSEKSAREIIETAKNQSKEIILKATQEGEMMVKNKISEANKVAKEMIEKAETEAQSESKEIIQKSISEVNDLKNRYSQIRETFASDFVTSFVKSKVEN